MLHYFGHALCNVAAMLRKYLGSNAMQQGGEGLSIALLLPTVPPMLPPSSRERSESQSRTTLE